MLDSKMLRMAVASDDRDHESALDQLRMQYGWALDDATRAKPARSRLRDNYERAEMLRGQLAALGEFHAPMMGRA